MTTIGVRLLAALLGVIITTVQGQGAAEERHYTEVREPCADYRPARRPLFGDLHVHTRYSLDASTQGTRTSPDQAYRFARGEALPIQPWNEQGEAARSLQLSRPLDFAMVSDHAELIGEVHMCNTPAVEGYGSLYCRFYRTFPRGAYYLFNYMSAMRASHLGLCGEDDELCKRAAVHPWAEMQDAAQAHYDRSDNCEFTTFVGYEWTGVERSSGGNLHRNILFRNARVPNLPVSYIDAPSAERLWHHLEQDCNVSDPFCEALSIPHNGNLSAGFMFSLSDSDGQPWTPALADLRGRIEPLVEIMQHKGSSECYYAAGVTRDELCAFEQLSIDNIAGFDNPPQPDTGFTRQTLNRGLELEAALGVNPFKLGILASTDTHLGAAGAAQESRFLGHGGAGVPALKVIPPGLPDKPEYNPGGLAVVWAEENSRDAIFAALQRRETYGTSGPRITARFFAGWDYDAQLCDAPDFVERAYAGGTPMGGDLKGKGNAPRFAVFARQDAGTKHSPGMPLQRIQIVKGWLDDTGAPRQRVIDVAGTADNGASVNLSTCEVTGKGATQLCSVWTDQDFNPRQRAWYYARVLENPSCRWSQRQCVAAGVQCDDPATIGEGYEACCAAEHRPVIQERAWTSPIWYSPAS